jgi:hypothetical protein
MITRLKRLFSLQRDNNASCEEILTEQAIDRVHLFLGFLAGKTISAQNI